MLVLSYVLFLLVSYFLVLQIFRLTTYHRYFFRVLPLLLAYSVLIGYAMYFITPIHGFWFTQIWASALLFIFGWWRQVRRFRAFVHLAGENPRDFAAVQ